MVYLGHVIGSGQLAVPELRAKAMAEFVRPKTKKGLRSFLGSVSYYRQFIPNIANYTALLTPSTSKMVPANVKWTEGMASAFLTLKNSLCNVRVLTVPSADDTFVLQTDASLLGIGAILSVIRDRVELPVSYFVDQRCRTQLFSN